MVKSRVVYETKLMEQTVRERTEEGRKEGELKRQEEKMKQKRGGRDEA